MQTARTWVSRSSHAESSRSWFRSGSTDGRLHYVWGGTFAPIAGMAQEPMNSPVLAIGILLIFIGLFAFSAVLLRLA